MGVRAPRQLGVEGQDLKDRVSLALHLAGLALQLLAQFGELGDGPGQFDLVHGVAIDRDHRIYVGDRSNNRIQVFTEEGEFIEEWPDVSDPVGVFIDENESVWVISARLNRLLKYNTQGELQYYLGAFGGTRGGFAGGLSRPHQMDVDQDEGGEEDGEEGGIEDGHEVD